MHQRKTGTKLELEFRNLYLGHVLGGVIFVLLIFSHWSTLIPVLAIIRDLSAS